MMLRPISMACAALLALTLPLAPARAQMFSDPAFESMFKARRYAELDRLAQPRLTAAADDAQAVLAAVLAAIQPQAQADQRKAALARAEACVERQPRAAACQYALGTMLGVQAMSEGILKMAGSVSRVKDALSEAHALAPQWFPARSALATYYLMVPGLMGGSRSKAMDLAKGASTPDHVQALTALVTLNDSGAEASARALKMLEAIPAGRDSALDDDVQGWADSAAIALLQQGDPARAQAWFERARRERPQEAMPAYALGRVQAERGVHAEALPWYERARALQGAEQLPLDYRAGLSQQALGQTAAAKASFTRFVQAGRGQKKALEDARKRLEQLAAS